ncbi:hypothetical protein JS533_005190 [Bifidobacterium amazonense]|uniref:Phage protein n=1 Tax=Bifidobacterium amazonense TaxID=2809027 RepID=A0ABS9VUB4_9BIFI|nr:hypothetical protein [Bifidobacterium amazonense]MCH9275668.1 hypothetical protein [Bifidobacterium amazonense]
MELEGLPPARQRDVLLDMLPALCRKYGDIGSVAAAEWYDTLWRRWFDGDFEAQPVNEFDDKTAREIIRAKAGLLFDKPDGTMADPAEFLRWANKFLDRNVKNPGRLTVQRNAQRDPRHPGYARVPSGVKTCPFCLMLAGRGYIYRSAETAGADHDFHDDCDCEIVPEWNKGGNAIEGYDPDRYEQMYRDARDALENPHADSRLLEAANNVSPYTVTITQKNGKRRTHTYAPGDPNNLNSLAAVMRRQHPDFFKGADGDVH